MMRLAFWAAALFALVMALLPHPPELPGNPPDKVQHAAAFGTLGLLGAFAFPRLSLARLLLSLSLFGAAIEIGQAIPSLNRDSDPVDWLVDTLAAGAVLFTVQWWLARKR